MNTMNIGPIDGSSQVPRADVRPSQASSEAQGVSGGADSVQISKESLFAANLVNEASKLPDVRPEVVADLKQQVTTGNYPPPAIVDGLARLIGQSLDKS